MSEDELRGLLGKTPAADAFAWRSPRAKALLLDASNPPADAELVRLMLEVPYLIRRPIIKFGGETVFGLDKKRLETVLEVEG